MRKVFAVLFALCALASANISLADTPAHLDEANFPTFTRPLSAAEQGHLGLSAKVLQEPLEVLNRRGPSDYRFDRLEPGEVILVDSTGTPRYKASCGNRIEVLHPPFKVTVMDTAPAVTPVAVPTKAAPAPKRGWFRAFLGDFFLALVVIALLVLGIILFAALLGGGFFLLRRMLEWFRDWRPLPRPTPAVPTRVLAPPPLPPAHPLFLWTIRNGSVEWDTALVASDIENGVGPGGVTTLEIRLTARPTTPTP